MSESARTITFVAVALASLIAAWATQPASAELDVASLVGEDLTKDFTDSTEAKRLRIVDFDEDSATLREFEVAEGDGLWTIPSKDGYPADAERQMAEAATALMDRKVLAVASEDAADHEQYGVVDPTSPKLEVGQKGVGRYVRISNIHDESLVELVIGHEVKDTTNEQHYVRRAGQDIVYVVELDPEPLSTNFEDWIEKDLLKLNPWDIAEVEIKDYSAELQPVMTAQGPAIQIAWDPRSELTVGYDDGDARWTPVSLKKFNPVAGEYEEFELADDQELNTDKLNGLKNALDDLKIVDVARKPTGLSADLKAGEDFLDNREAISDLRSRGFAAIPASTGRDQEIISNEGEVICTTNDGVEYVLRFGDLRMSAGGGEKKKEQADDDQAEPESTGKDVQRYLFAMARFNEDAVKRPELADLPELPVLPEGAAVSEAEEDSAETAIEEEEEEQESDEGAASENADLQESLAATRSGAVAGDDGEVVTEADSAETADSADAADEEASDGDEESDAIAAAIAERKRIETENQRKLDEYQEKLDKGRETVRDLNLRFGDWYFVVSNDTFQKIRLSREDVIKKKAATGDASAAGAPGTSVPGLPSIPGVGQ